MFYYDPYYILVIIGVIISMIASARVSGTFRKFDLVRSRTGMTGAEAAKRLLQAQGIYDVSVQRVSGELTDHYDPRDRVLRLSDSTFGSTSVAAIGVAAHECGHAMRRELYAADASLGSGAGGELRFPFFHAADYRRAVYGTVSGGGGDSAV